MFKSFTRTLFRRFGFEISRYNLQSSFHRQTSSALEISSPTLVVDIGANVGQFAQSILNLELPILSIEPLPSIYSTLKSNSDSCPYWHTCPYPLAIGSFDGYVDINESKNTFSSSILSINDIHTDINASSAYRNSYNVKQMKLDSYLKQSSFDLSRLALKIDVQGYELEVLKGASFALSSSKFVLLELSLVPLYINQPLWLELVEFMYENNFYLWGLSPGFSDPVSGQNLQFDAIFLQS